MKLVAIILFVVGKQPTEGLRINQSCFALFLIFFLYVFLLFFVVTLFFCHHIVLIEVVNIEVPNTLMQPLHFLTRIWITILICFALFHFVECAESKSNEEESNIARNGEDFFFVIFFLFGCVQRFMDNGLLFKRGF